MRIALNLHLVQNGEGDSPHALERATEGSKESCRRTSWGGRGVGSHPDWGKGGINDCLNVRVPITAYHSHSWPALLRTRPTTPLNRQSAQRKVVGMTRTSVEAASTAQATGSRSDSANEERTADGDGETPVPRENGLDVTSRALAPRDVNAGVTNRVPCLPTRELVDQKDQEETTPTTRPVGEAIEEQTGTRAPGESTRKRSRSNRKRRSTGTARRERFRLKRARID